jgi:hypothetical protein
VRTCNSDIITNSNTDIRDTVNSKAFLHMNIGNSGVDSNSCSRNNRNIMDRRDASNCTRNSRNVSNSRSLIIAWTLIKAGNPPIEKMSTTAPRRQK